jgi:hypothetical protein
MQTSRSPHKKRWTWKLLLGGALVPASLIGGCESMSHTDKGVLGGAALGGLAGGLIGKAAGNTAAGAVIGAAAGGVTGGVIGNAADRAEAKQAAQAAAAQRGPLGIEEIARMSQQGVGDGVIIDQIRLSGIVYNLSAEQIIWLQQSGVHEPVIREMQATAYRPGRRVYVAQPVYAAPPPVVVVEPAPPPPTIGFGVSYTKVR